jgi:hypothetical protein
LALLVRSITNYLKSLTLVLEAANVPSEEIPMYEAELIKIRDYMIGRGRWDALRVRARMYGSVMRFHIGHINDLSQKLLSTPLREQKIDIYLEAQFPSLTASLSLLQGSGADRETVARVLYLIFEELSSTLKLTGSDVRRPALCDALLELHHASLDLPTELGQARKKFASFLQFWLTEENV